MSQKELCQKFVNDYLFHHPCEKCGEKDIILLEFAHIDRATKLYNVSSLLNQGKYDLMLEEIKKTKILCVSCHRRETAKESNWTKIMHQSNDELLLETFDNDTLENLENDLDF